jgi:hypothetical protein
MEKYSQLTNAKKDEMERIISQQNYPVEFNEDLRQIAHSYPEVGLFETIIRAFSLGMIHGKRLERSKRK